MTFTSASPQIPIVNAGELYLNGLQLSITVDNPEVAINVKAGAARNSTNVNDIILQQNVIARLDRQGLNGLDTGTLADDTLYAVYVIGASFAQVGGGQATSQYPVGILLSKEMSRPYMPAGYDMFRRIGAVATDGNGDIVPFFQVGNDTCRTMKYGQSATLISNGNATTWADVEINLETGSVLMPSIATNVYLVAAYNATDVFNSFYLQPAGQPDAAYYVSGAVTVANQVIRLDVVCPCNEDAVFNYEVDDNGSSLTLLFRGYDDLL